MGPEPGEAGREEVRPMEAQPRVQRSGEHLRLLTVLREFGKAMGQPGPVTPHWSPVSPRNGPALAFLLGHWWEQLRGQGLGANCKLRDNSGALAGFPGQSCSLHRPGRQILMAPHCDTYFMCIFSFNSEKGT